MIRTVRPAGVYPHLYLVMGQKKHLKIYTQIAGGFNGNGFSAGAFGHAAAYGLVDVHLPYFLEGKSLLKKLCSADYQACPPTP